MTMEKVASEEEQIEYLRGLRDQQIQLCCQEEEQCTFLASMLLRSHFKNLTETSLYAAFRKKNVHPDELSQNDDVRQSVGDANKRAVDSSNLTAPLPAAKKARPDVRVNEVGEIIKSAPENIIAATAVVTEEKTEPTTTTSATAAATATAAAAVGPDEAAKGPRKDAARKARAAAARKIRIARRQEIEAAKQAPRAAAFACLPPPPVTAGEAARLLGEKLLQRLASGDAAVTCATRPILDDAEASQQRAKQKQIKLQQQQEHMKLKQQRLLTEHAAAVREEEEARANKEQQGGGGAEQEQEQETRDAF